MDIELGAACRLLKNVKEFPLTLIKIQLFDSLIIYYQHKNYMIFLKFLIF